MSYLLLNDAGAVEVYPYSIAKLKKDNPGTSFPETMSEERLAEWSVYRVLPNSAPAVDDTKNCAEGTPTLVDGAWTQTWIVTDATPEQIAERLAEQRQRMVVSPLQMRRALRQQGLADAVAAYVAAQDADTQDAWEYAVEIRRTDALIVQAASALGKTEAEIDDLFRLAATF